MSLWNSRSHPCWVKPGQWTDDASMGLCLGESLLTFPELIHPIDLRIRFLNWWDFGYCNAFGYDSITKKSIGLGGYFHVIS